MINSVSGLKMVFLVLHIKQTSKQKQKQKSHNQKLSKPLIQLDHKISRSVSVFE